MIPLIIVSVVAGKVVFVSLTGYGAYTLGKQGYDYYYPNNESIQPQTNDSINRTDYPPHPIGPVILEHVDSIHSDLNERTALITTQHIQNWITMSEAVVQLKHAATQSSEASTQLNDLIPEWIELSHVITREVQTMQHDNHLLQSRLMNTVNQLQNTQTNLSNQEQTFSETINTLRNQCRHLTTETETARQHIRELSSHHQMAYQNLSNQSEEQIIKLNNQIKTLSDTNESLMGVLTQFMQQNNEATHLAGSPDSVTFNPSNENSTRFFK